MAKGIDENSSLLLAMLYVYLLAILLAKKGQHRNAPRFNFQYPMKNQVKINGEISAEKYHKKGNFYLI